MEQCEKYLPSSLEVLTLAKNNIGDLNEICTLSHISYLTAFTFAGNPCVIMTDSTLGFDYRPFMLNWLMSVKLIDGFVVTPIESLKAEWLYSQGRGRQFRVGEQEQLSKYLSSVCPLSGEALENENERKLRIILSKAQQHQRQLQEQISDPNPSSTNSSPSTIRRRALNRVQSPRFTRLVLNRNNSPDSMSYSYHGSIMNSSISSYQYETSLQPSLEMTKSLIENFTSDIMSQSVNLTSSLPLNGNSPTKNNIEGHIISKTPEKSPIKLVATQPTIVRSLKEISLCNGSPQYNDQTNLIINSGPLVAATKMMPVPETLMSPDCPTRIITQRIAHVPTPQIPKPVTTSNVKGKYSSKENSLSSQDSLKVSKTRPVVAATKVKLDRNSSVQLSPQKKMGNNGVTEVKNNSPCLSSSVKESISYKITPPPPVIHSSDDESEKMKVEKLQPLLNKVLNKKSLKQKQNLGLTNISKTTENSAIMIQKIWRGYSIRKRHSIAQKIENKRTNNHIQKLTKDMEETKVALEKERKIQQLQMQAINSLWKKVSALQHQQQQFTPTATTPSHNMFEEGLKSATVSLNFDNQSVNVVQDLTKTCSMLMTQVQQLQHSTQDMVTCLTQLSQQNSSAAISTTTSFCRTNIEIQTDIVAVNTPNEDVTDFPFKKKQLRPSSLPINCSSTETSPKNFQVNAIELNKEESFQCNTETLVVQTSEFTVFDDSQVIDTDSNSEVESEKEEETVNEVDETIADASSICTENYMI